MTMNVKMTNAVIEDSSSGSCNRSLSVLVSSSSVESDAETAVRDVDAAAHASAAAHRALDAPPRDVANKTIMSESSSNYVESDVETMPVRVPIPSIKRGLGTKGEEDLTA